MARRRTTGFKREATSVLTDLKHAFRRVIVSLGVDRPTDLQRKLGLKDTLLSWQVFKVANSSSVLAAGAVVPSRASLKRLTNALSKSAAASEHASAVSAAYEDFEDLVQRHAGERASFNSLAVLSSGETDELTASDLQHRRNIFRSCSHIVGYQVKTWLMCSVVASSKKGYGYDTVSYSGRIGLRLLRPRERLRVYGFWVGADNDIAEWSNLEPLNAGGPMDGYCVTEFCSQPLPEMEAQSGEAGLTRWKTISLVNPDVGNLGVSDLVFGCRVHHIDSPPNLFQFAAYAPTEILIHDVLFEPGLLTKKRPDFDVLLRRHGPLESVPDFDQINGPLSPEYLGKGPDAVATSAFPRYTELLRTASEQLGRDIGQFDAWRGRTEFPMLQSMSRLRFELVTSSAKGKDKREEDKVSPVILETQGGCH